DRRCLLRRSRASRDSQPHFIGIVVRAERASVQRRPADEIDSELGEPAIEPLAHDVSGQVRARDRVRTAVPDFALADVSGEIADADLQVARTWAAGGAAHGDAI